MCLGRRPVDLVREKQVREDRPPDEPEFLLHRVAVHFEDLRAGDVGGHQVRSELDPLELHVQNLGDGPDHQRLRHAGHAHQQAVAAGQQHHQDLVQHFHLAHDRFAHFLPDGVRLGLRVQKVASNSGRGSWRARRTGGGASSGSATRSGTVSDGWGEGASDVSTAGGTAGRSTSEGGSAGADPVADGAAAAW